MNDCIVNLQHGKHYDRTLDFRGNICRSLPILPYLQLQKRPQASQSSLQRWWNSGLVINRDYPVRTLRLQANHVGAFLSYICRD